MQLHILLCWCGWKVVGGHVCESFWLLLSKLYPAVLLQLKSDDRPPHVVTVLMQELSANNENDWAEHLVGEMVEGAASFKHSQDAMHILKESLALSCFGEEFVGEQLKAGHNGLYHCLAAVLCAVLCCASSSNVCLCLLCQQSICVLFMLKHHHGLVIYWLHARQHAKVLHAIA